MRITRRAALASGLLLAAIIGAAPPARSMEPAPVQDAQAGDLFFEADDGWQTYINGRFGMQVSYPSEVFTPAEPPQDGAGRRFDGAEATMEVFGWDNEDRETAASLASKLIGTAGYEDLSGTDIGEERLVLTGERGDRSFYELYVFRESSVQAFGMDYPVALGTVYQPLAQEIAATFLHGEEDAPDVLAEEAETYRGVRVPETAPPAAVAPRPAARTTGSPAAEEFRVLRSPVRAAARPGKPPKAQGHGKNRPKGKRGKRRGKGKKR